MFALDPIRRLPFWSRGGGSTNGQARTANVRSAEAARALPRLLTPSVRKMTRFRRGGGTPIVVDYVSEGQVDDSVDWRN
ncbi:hypothetical protein AH06_00470 [candidate division TM6 bacterium Zodletone_IIa]|nr:hypothetical protein AH06_00470 [candidate division TM6 bacterium Zodletone_IIa]